MIRQTTDGGFILGGYSSSDSSGDKSENSCYGNDYWVVKIDVNGVIQWENSIGADLHDALTCLEQTADGGYILGGESFSHISCDKSEDTHGSYDSWVVKLDSSGNILWEKTIGTSSVEQINSLQLTSDGGYVLGGSILLTNWEYLIVKIDSIGNLQWQKKIGGSAEDKLLSICTTSDSGFICGGYSFSNISGDKTENSLGGKDYWVIKLDAVGNIQWQNTIGGSDYDGIESLEQTTDGGYILGGFSVSGISGDKTEGCNGYVDYWVVKLDAVGNIQWQNTIGGSMSDELYSIQ